MKKKIAIFAAVLVVGSFTAAYAWKNRSDEALDRFRYFRSSQYQRWFKGRRAHNRVLVHEGDQRGTESTPGGIRQRGTRRLNFCKRRAESKSLEQTWTKCCADRGRRKLPKPTLPRRDTAKLNWRKLKPIWRGREPRKRMPAAN